MKIALVGYGAMGTMVANEAARLGMEIVSRVDPANREADHRVLSADALRSADVAIDFSAPTAVLSNIRTYCEQRVAAVIGTTGWTTALDEVRSLVTASKIRFLWSSNYSVGVQAYFRIIDYTAHLFRELEEYDVWAYELHHRNKGDSPSGTAKTLSDIIIRAMGRKQVAVYDKLDRRIAPHEFHVASVRGGEVNFEHTVGFDSSADAITIKHAARNRSGYAQGALRAASWLLKKEPGFYDIDDLMDGLFGGEGT